jgi:hypothetical protein
MTHPVSKSKYILLGCDNMSVAETFPTFRTIAIISFRGHAVQEV